MPTVLRRLQEQHARTTESPNRKHSSVQQNGVGRDIKPFVGEEGKAEEASGACVWCPVCSGQQRRASSRALKSLEY